MKNRKYVHDRVLDNIVVYLGMFPCNFSIIFRGEKLDSDVGQLNILIGDTRDPTLTHLGTVP